MDRVAVNGTVMRLELKDAEVINYGTIMHLTGSNVTVSNNGTIMHNSGTVGTGVRIVYRDRYITNQQTEETIKKLEKELEDTKKKLAAANRETRRLSQQIREFEIAPKQDEQLRDAEEKLELVIEVNRKQANRIKELERGVCDAYLRQQIDPWDIKPTKEQCQRLLRDIDNLIEIQNQYDYE